MQTTYSVHLIKKKQGQLKGKENILTILNCQQNFFEKLSYKPSLIFTSYTIHYNLK